MEIVLQEEHGDVRIIADRIAEAAETIYAEYFPLLWLRLRTPLLLLLFFLLDEELTVSIFALLDSIFWDWAVVVVVIVVPELVFFLYMSCTEPFEFNEDSFSCFSRLMFSSSPLFGFTNVLGVWVAAWVWVWVCSSAGALDFEDVDGEIAYPEPVLINASVWRRSGVSFPDSVNWTWSFWFRCSIF